MMGGKIRREKIACFLRKGIDEKSTVAVVWLVC